MDELRTDLRKASRSARLAKNVVVIGLVLLAATAIGVTLWGSEPTSAQPSTVVSDPTVQAWAIPRPNRVQFLLPKEVLHTNAPSPSSRCTDLFRWAQQFDLVNLESMRLAVRFTSSRYVQLSPEMIRVWSIDDSLQGTNVNDVGLVRCADSNVNYIDTEPLQDGFIDTGDDYPIVAGLPSIYPHGNVLTAKPDDPYDSSNKPRGASLSGSGEIFSISPGEKFTLQVDVGLAAGVEPPTRFGLEVKARVNGVLRTFSLTTDGNGKPFEIYPYFGGMGGPKPEFYEWKIGTPGRMAHRPPFS